MKLGIIDYGSMGKMLFQNLSTKKHTEMLTLNPCSVGSGVILYNDPQFLGGRQPQPMKCSKKFKKVLLSYRGKKMKKKLSFIFLILINVCFVNVAFAQSEWIMLNNNVKTSTFGNTKYFDKKFSVDEAVQVMMFLSRGYNEWNFDVKTYSKKEFAKTKDFSDEYIYGSAVNAVTKLGYGLVAMDYYLFENEVVSEEGWNGMYLMRLKDDSILCAKLIKPTGAYIADECVWDQNKDMLILSNKNFAYEIHICLYGLPIEEGEYQVLGSDGEYKLEADCIDNGNWAEAKTTLFIRYDGNTIKAYGNAFLYTPTNDNIDFYYKGNLVVQ